MKQLDRPRKAILADLYTYLSNSAIKISAFISFITAVLTFISLLWGYRRLTLLTFLALLTIAISIAWLFLLHIYRKKVEVINEHIYLDGDPQVIINNKYSGKVRRLALVGIIILPLVIFSIFGWMTVKNFSSRETIILVSNLRGNADEKFLISDQIRGKLLTLTRQRMYWKVLKPSENILDESTREFAEKIQENNASISLTGWCRDQGKLKGEIYFYDSSNSLIDTISIGEDNSQPSTISDSNIIIKQLADEINYRIAFIIGRKLYEGKDYKGAIELFSVAGDQTKRAQGSIEPDGNKPTDILNASKIYYYRGLAYFDSGQTESALGDFTKVNPNVFEKDITADLYYHRGLCYLILGDPNSFLAEKRFKCAIAEFQKARTLNNNTEYLKKCEAAYNKLKGLGKNDMPNCLEVNQDWIAQQSCEEQDAR